MSAAAPSGRPKWAVPAALLATGVFAGGAGWLLAGRAAPTPSALSRQAYHVAATVEAKPRFNTLVGVAPDDRFLVYTAWPELPPESVKPEGVLVIRRLDRDETTVIEGTEGARDGALSPDGRWLAFASTKDRAGTKVTLKKVPLDNGRPTGKPETVYELPSGSLPTMCWASDREIAFSPNFELVIQSISISGGEPREVLREERPKGIESWGEFRPLVPGRSILATRWSFVGQKVKLTTEAIDLASGKRTLVLSDAGLAQYVADEHGGYLVASRSTQTSLIAVRFDAENLRVIGDPVTVWSGNPLNTFRVSPGGTLAISTRPTEVPDRRLAWLDEKGQPQPVQGMMRSYMQIAVSPDGGRVLASMESAGTAELISECWVQDLARRTSTRISIQGAMIGMAWNPDGREFTYGLAKDGGFSIVRRRADGSGEPVTLHSSPDSRTLAIPTAWSPDGKSLALIQVDMSTDSADVFVIQQDDATTKWEAKPYVKTPAFDSIDRFSPDGKWVIIVSGQSGRQELYVQPFTGDGEADARARRQISTSGGGTSWWSPDGDEIRFLDFDGQIMSAAVKTEPTFSAGDPKLIYSVKDLKTRAIVPGPDGRYMVILQGESEQTTAAVGVVLNFVAELRNKLNATNQR